MTDQRDSGPRVIRDIGRAATAADGTVFVPALVDFSGCEKRLGAAESLDDYLATHDPKPLPLGTDEHYGRYDGVWARARLPTVFGYAPLPYVWGDPRFALVDETFVARSSSGAAHVLVCTERNMRVRVLFDAESTDAEQRARLAAMFWELLLADPNDLADFDDHFVEEDPGGGALICSASYRAGSFSVSTVEEFDGDPPAA